MSFDPHNPAPRIVIPIVAGIGNALMAVPLVRQIKRKLPGARITVIARTDAMADPFRRLSEVDEVLVTGKGFKSIVRNILWSRRRKPDVFLATFPSNRWQYSLLALFSGAGQRILHSYPVGYWRALHFLPSTRVPAQRGIHDVAQNLNLLRALGLEPDAPDAPVFPLTDADRTRAASRLRECRIAPDAHPIVVHAGSAQTVLSRAKRWSPHSYAQLIRHLFDEFGEDILLIEGPDEAGVSEEILHSTAATAPAPRILRMTGPLGETAAVLEQAQLYVGSDSGLGHLAAAVGTRVVSIFAPADPERVCPFGNRDLVVQASTPCAPCFQYPWNTPYPRTLCREPLCINTVSVDSVFAAVRRALAPSASTELPSGAAR